jgi:hypothetical protein
VNSTVYNFMDMRIGEMVWAMISGVNVPPASVGVDGIEMQGIWNVLREI